MNKELWQAYVDAIYRVDGKMDFRIGKYSPALARLHEAHGARHSDFITAFNPASKRLSAAENVARHTELGEQLEALGANRLPAAGVDPNGEWPPEPGYLVFDLAHEQILALGRAWGQNATVHIDTDAIPRLVRIPHR